MFTRQLTINRTWNYLAFEIGIPPTVGKILVSETVEGLHYPISTTFNTSVKCKGLIITFIDWSPMNEWATNNDLDTTVKYVGLKVLGKKIMDLIVTSLVPVYTFDLSHLRRNPLLPCLHCLQRLP